MYNLTFKNVGEIRMGSPFNMAEVVLTGGYIPDLSNFTFQDVGLVDPVDSMVYLVQWDIKENQPGFKVWQISSIEKSVRKTSRLEGCCKKMSITNGNVSLQVFRNGKIETINVHLCDFKVSDKV